MICPHQAALSMLCRDESEKPKNIPENSELIGMEADC